MSANYSALLLATIAPIAGRPGAEAATLSAEHLGKLRDALNAQGAMVAVNGSEYLGIYDRPVTALIAATTFHGVVEGLLALNGASFAARVVLDAWPTESADMPVDHVHAVLAHASESALLLTGTIIGQLPPDQRRHLMMPPGSERHPELAQVREYGWKDSATTYREHTRVVSTGRAPEALRSVTLTRRDKNVEVLPEHCPFSIGRDSSCGMSAGGPTVSRLHGEVQFENGRFYYRDLSRNGSYITSSGDETYLQQDRMPLARSGVISPGATLVEQTGDVIRFSCNALTL